MISSFFAVFLPILVHEVLVANAKVYGNVKDLPKTNYDFIVVGGGTAGNTIANRLTENPLVSVLVLEAGGSNEGAINSIVPFFCTLASPNTPLDWNYTTSAQPGLNGRSIAYPRGHVLGGSSSINFMAYTRGSSSDWDRYASITGDEGWSWDSIQPYFRKNEVWTSPADGHNTTGQFDPSVHSTSGINAVSLAGFPTGLDNRIIQTTQELSEEFPFNLDMNSGDTLGVGWMQSTIKGGQRSSSATSYLGPDFINRPNLHVLIGARVTRLVETSKNRGVSSVRTVEFAQSETGPRTRFTASKEVILSAGAVGTPQILLLSGIGDRKALQTLKIPTLLHQPDVGRNLSDHPLLANIWLINSTDTFDTVVRNSTLALAAFQEWNETQTGLLVDSPLDHLAWLRLPGNSTIFNQTPDPAAGSNAAHFELLFLNGIASTDLPPSGNFMTIVTAVVSPTSRGSITLASTNPFDQPIINPNLLGTDFDIFTMREAVHSAERFVTAPVWDDYVIGAAGGLESTNTDADLDSYIRSNTVTIFHPVGTAAMSPKGASYGVVDPDLRVKGLSGLRIVDVSVLPIVPAAHTQVPAYVVGERAADLVKSLWML